MADLMELLLAPLLPAGPAQKTYTPGVNFDTGEVETPETIGLKTLMDQLSGRTYENLIRPMSSPVGAGMTALTVGAPGAAAPLNRLLSALLVPQMVGQGAKDIKTGDYADATMALAFAPLAAMGGIKVKGFNSKPAGSTVTPAARTYNEGAARQGSNVWVRQSDSASNSDRTLLVQFSNDLINPRGAGPRSRADAYYDKLYQSRSGYDRPADFWEIPQWQANIAHNVPNADVYVVRNPTEAVQFANKAGYKNVAFSALDVTRPLIRDFAAQYKGNVTVGGYGDVAAAFKDMKNVKVYSTVKDFVHESGGKYREGFDYRHYHGTKTMPRLTMSDGCKHQCAFCTVPKKVTERSRAEIIQQAEAFAKDLPSSLVYINDKTFGQAKNHTLLPEINAMLKKSNPEFQGFVIQTTAAQMKRMDPQYMKDAGIKYAELGIESFNDPVLRASKKPATEAIIDSAANKLREAGVTMIPNIMVGLPGETPASYARTMDWLRRNDDNISHVNVNNLAVYDDAVISKTLKNTTASDVDQHVVAKSWMDDPATPTKFYDDVADWASGQLEKTPRPRRTDFQTIGGGEGIPSEMRQGPQLTELLTPPKPGEPAKTRKAYKLFRQEGGKLYPMFIGAKDEVPVGQWVPAENKPTAGFAERPGWHASELPVAPQIGSLAPGAPKGSPPAFRRPNEVWAEVELPADVDWQTKANQLGTNRKGEVVAGKAHLDKEIPVGGHYTFKTNPNAAGNWYIGGGLKVNRILGDEEVALINKQAGMSDLPREGANLGELLTPPAAAEAVAPAYQRKFKPTDLGEVVEPEGIAFKGGFIMPDGTVVRMSAGAKSHGATVSQAKGRTGRNTMGWQGDAHDEGIIRLSESAMGTGAEMYTPPTDAQIRALRAIEKAQGFDMGWDLTDPFYTGRPGSLPIIGTGSGVKGIRGEIEFKKYNPMRPVPTEPKKTSELFEPDFPLMGLPGPMPPVPMNALLQGGMYA